MRGLISALAFASFVAGCSPLDFHPDHPGREYPRLVQAASRIRSSDGCASIGTITLNDAADPHIEAIAQRVADEGGDSYTVREMHGATTLHTDATSVEGWGGTYTNATTYATRQTYTVIDVLICHGYVGD